MSEKGSSEPERLVLLDLDIVKKLAAYDLLDILPRAFALPWSAFSSVPSAYVRALKASTGKNPKPFPTADAAARASAVLKPMAPLPPPDPKVLEILQHSPGIDPGEAVLFAVAARRNMDVISSGDKRALAAFDRVAAPYGYFGLKGRIYCFEQLALAAIEQRGLAVVCARVRAQPTVDTALSIICGSAGAPDSASVMAGFSSYLADLRGKCAALAAELPKERPVTA